MIQAFTFYEKSDDPHKTIQNKNAIQKVMFLSVFFSTLFDDEGTCTFDGELGMWTFVRKVAHLFSSFNPSISETNLSPYTTTWNQQKGEVTIEKDRLYKPRISRLTRAP
jgi:hypothetical protein